MENGEIRPFEFGISFEPIPRERVLIIFLFKPRYFDDEQKEEYRRLCYQACKGCVHKEKHRCSGIGKNGRALFEPELDWKDPFTIDANFLKGLCGKYRI